MLVARMVGQVKPAFFDGDVGDFLLAARAFEFGVLGVNLGLKAAVVVIGKLEENQPQHRGGVFAGLQVGIGTQLVGGTP
jgi:hypothetical protein